MMDYDLFYCIGDSFVHAVDQSDDLQRTVTHNNRFTGLISSHYGLREVNKGLSGASNEYIFRTIYNDMLEYKRNGINPFVLVLYTDHNRKEIWSSKNNIPYTLGEYIASKAFIKEWYSEHFNDTYNKHMSDAIESAIKFMLTSYGIDYLDGHSLTPDKNIKYNTHLDMPVGDFCAPDRFPLTDKNDFDGHPTVQGHKRIAKWIIDKIDSLYNT